jgi:hypothetical protein
MEYLKCVCEGTKGVSINLIDPFSQALQNDEVKIIKVPRMAELAAKDILKYARQDP